MLCIKLSALHFYYRVFGGIQDSRFCKACLVMMAVVTLYFVVCIVTVLLSCIPMSKNWDSDIPGNCVDGSTRMIVTAAINLIIDIMIVALPMPVIQNLNLQSKQRRLLYAVFGAGWL